MFDSQVSGLGGGVVIAGLIYAGASLYVTAPLVTQRIVEKSGWLAQCERSLLSEIETHRSSSSGLPPIDCQSLMRTLDPAMRQMIDAFGGGVACQMIDAKRHQQEAIERLRQQRMQSVADRAGSRCHCAVSSLIETKRLSLGLYAGSARLLEPALIKNLDGELTGALHAPHCAAIAPMGAKDDGGAS